MLKLSGYGLHSGEDCTVYIHQDEGSVRFKRGSTFIPAQLEAVVATPRCTVLGQGKERVAMVEHLLAALYATNWWTGLLIEVTGPELPILDGSAAPWLEHLNALGEPPPRPEGLFITQDFEYKNAESCIRLEAGEEQLTVSIDFEHPAIGQQRWSGKPETYKSLLSARTFGFLKELESLQEAGLASKASLENAIVFDTSGAMQSLRCPDEPVRHKALDALGDFFLLGRPLQGSLYVHRGSHQTHINFLQALTAQQGATP